MTLLAIALACTLASAGWLYFQLAGTQQQLDDANASNAFLARRLRDAMVLPESPSGAPIADVLAIDMFRAELGVRGDGA